MRTHCVNVDRLSSHSCVLNASGATSPFAFHSISLLCHASFHFLIRHFRPQYASAKGSIPTSFHSNRSIKFWSGELVSPVIISIFLHYKPSQYSIVGTLISAIALGVHIFPFLCDFLVSSNWYFKILFLLKIMSNCQYHTLQPDFTVRYII